jgi:hypothetical protein
MGIHTHTRATIILLLCVFFAVTEPLLNNKRIRFTVPLPSNDRSDTHVNNEMENLWLIFDFCKNQKYCHEMSSGSQNTNSHFKVYETYDRKWNQKMADSIPDWVIVFFFIWPNPSSRTMTQPLIKMSTRNLPGGKGRPARKADNLTAICESIV